MPRRNQWTRVADWLKTEDANWFVDEATSGTLPAYEADSLLMDFDICVNVESRRTLALLVSTTA